MRVLQVCPKPPFPPVDGGTRAMQEIALGLASLGHRVHMICLATPKHPDRLPGQPLPPGISIETVAVDTRLRLAAGLANLASCEPYAVARHRSPALADALEQRLGEAWDVIQLEGLAAAPALSRTLRSGNRVVFRAHNIEHELWSQRAGAARWPLQPWLRAQARRVARLERACWRRAHGIAAISAEVAAACGGEAAGPVLELPVGFAIATEPPPILAPARLFHLGAMDWAPTADGMAWFLGSVWPLVLARHPQARLHLAGRAVAGFGPARQAPNVVIDGEVTDAEAWVRQGGVLVAPVRSGSGLRVKTAEAMAQGRAVVTTSLGASGLGAEPGRHLLLADDAAGLAAELLRCLASEALVRALGAAAHQLAGERFERATLARKLVRFYDSLPRPE